MSNTQPNPSSSDDLLIDYVRRALDRIERGEPVDVAALCADHPELADAVAEVVGLRGGLGAIGRAVEDRDPRSGRVLGGRYRLETVLGKGAMGVVYRATDSELQRAVAVKLFDIVGRAPDRARERFLQESRLLARLRHRHVVAVYDRGEDEDGTLFLVMDLLEGTPLSAVLADIAAEPERPLPERLDALFGTTHATPPESTLLRLLVRWCADVATGLHAAHAAGVFHRDVKPSNVFVTRDLRALLLDFGIAAGAGDPALTTTESTLGTPWYMAPEQATGDERATAAIDVYGVAATLYHLVTGRPPHEGDAARVFARIADEDPVPPHRLRPDLPTDLCAIIEKGLEREPRRRYASAAALAHDLHAFLEHRPVSARPLGPVSRARRRVRRHPARTSAIALATVVVLLLAIGLPLWSRARARDDEVRREELYAALPALLAVEGQPAQRLLVDLSERGELLALLDELLDLAPDDHASRLWRAALRLDAGDHDGAATDLRTIAARSEDSPYLAAVAERFARANREQPGTTAVPLDDLPTPASALDHYVAGFHELRNRHVAGFAARAHEHLDAAVAQDYRAARDLRLIALVSRGQAEGRRDLIDTAVIESERLEEAYGRPTARTTAIRGAALVLLRRYAEAIAPLETSIAIRPDRHGPWINLGIAHRKLRQFGDAERCLETAVELRPHFWNSIVSLAQLRAFQGRFDEALDLCDRLPDDGSGNLVWLRPELRSEILLRQAIACLRAEDLDGTNACTAAGIAAVDAALADAPARNRNRLRARRVNLTALGEAALGEATTAYLNALRLDADNPYQIADLATMLPSDGLDENGVWLLRLWLRRLAIALGDSDPAFVARQRDEYDRDKKEAPSPPEGR